MKRKFNSDCQQFHQYQQNEQTPLTPHHSENKKRSWHIWHWKYRSWLGTGTKMWWGL